MMKWKGFIGIATILLAALLLFSTFSNAQESDNNRPTANAGLNRNVRVNDNTLLSGSGYDGDGDDLTYRWLMIDKPGGSNTFLLSDNAQTASFTPDLAGPYIFSLRTNDGTLFSMPSNVVIIAGTVTDNARPVPYAGVDRTVNIGEEETLAGIGFDDEGASIRHIWFVKNVPYNSKVSISDLNLQSPTFIANVRGTYEFDLIVNDGKQDSPPDTVRIKASSLGLNRAPSADAGYPKSVKEGELITLAGTGSDPDRDPLTFIWAIAIKPVGSLSVLSNNNRPNPTFMPDMPGNFTFVLIVDDGKIDSTPDAIIYEVAQVSGNTKPASSAGQDTTASTGDEIVLPGSGSDVDGDAIYFRWSITDRPASSGTKLSNPNTAKPKVKFDAPGDYIFQLITNDNKEDSLPDYISIVVSGPAPECITGRCNTTTKEWCDNEVWTDANYCDNCVSVDSTCANACTGKACNTDDQLYCEDGFWVNSTYSEYCSRCGYTDTDCPTCKEGVCDIVNQAWCDEDTWSVIDYCTTCGKFDSACNVTCNSNSCDTNNRKWCNKGIWDEREYCVKCGQVDSSCSVTCQENKCDTENKKRCYKGRWNSTTYCDFCKGYDFSCGETCRFGTCDNVANKWCNSGTWDSLDYCDRCQDSECLDLCSYNACDQNAKKWCNSGTWDYIGYCQKCGRVDSTCQAICSENKCDVASNKICRNEDWTSDDYCNSCSLFDLDCTLTCAEGQCDVATKKVCKEGEWTEDSYCDSCAEKDTSCKPPCLLGEDGCCSGEADGICDPDCTAAEDEDCDDIECRADGSCILGNRCGNDVDCLSNLCLNDICEESKCDNNIQDGKESDIDCGGNCEGCKLGQICSWSSDCLYELSCTGGQCSEKDSDSDGILDKWEKENGLDPEDPLDAQMDFDEDGLTNLMEYTYGTNPNNADSDGDGASDKEEIDEGTDPLDPVSKPGGIGGLLFWTVISVIIFAAGSYVFHYYKDYFIKPKASKSTSTSEYMPQTPYEPQTSISNKILEEERIHEIVKERRKKKEEKRAKLLEPFGKRGKNKKPLLSIREGQESKLHKTHTSNKKEKKKDVFSKLKLLSKKEKK